jgi:hypothetical protein
VPSSAHPCLIKVSLFFPPPPPPPADSLSLSVCLSPSVSIYSSGRERARPSTKDKCAPASRAFELATRKDQGPNYRVPLHRVPFIFGHPESFVFRFSQLRAFSSGRAKLTIRFFAAALNSLTRPLSRTSTPFEITLRTLLAGN